jgi:outer membrane protein assembly factor BamB
MDGFIYALDTGSGEALWQFAIEDEADYGPTVVNGVVYVGTDRGHIYAIGGSERVAAAER